MNDQQREAFEKWASERWGSHAYLHTSNTSGEWEAWQAALTQPQAQQAAAVPAGDDWATIAGLESSVGHLSALVDEQRDLLAEVEDIFGRDGHGGQLEDGESELIDRIRSHLEMIAAPAAPPAPVLPLSAQQPMLFSSRKKIADELGIHVTADFNAIVRAVEKHHGITAHGAGGE